MLKISLVFLLLYYCKTHCTEILGKTYKLDVHNYIKE